MKILLLKKWLRKQPGDVIDVMPSMAKKLVANGVAKSVDDVLEMLAATFPPVQVAASVPDTEAPPAEAAPVLVVESTPDVPTASVADDDEGKANYYEEDDE